MSLFAIWQQTFGISYADSLTAALVLGLILGVYSFALGVDPFGWLKEKPRR